MKVSVKKYDVVIGIDPDVEKSGVACLDMAARKLEISTLAFPDLLDYLRYAQRQAEVEQKSLRVVIEAGWLNKSNWHLQTRDTKAVAAAKGNNAGRNHEVGRKIAEMCEHWQIPYELVRPLRKIWRGKDGKITHEELNKQLAIKGLPHLPRSNQDTRDAVLLGLTRI